MSLKNIYIIFGVFLFGLSGCAVTDMHPSADFNRYRTFAWGESEIKVSNPVYDSDLINKRIRHTVEDEFAKRGIRKNSNNPDFLVRYHTYTEEKKESTGGYPYHYRYYPYGFYPFAYGWGYPFYWMSPQQTREYTEGTMILDIIDRRSEELIWRGSVSGNVEDESRLRKQIEKGIRAIMKKYPVSPEEPLKVDQDVIS